MSQHSGAIKGARQLKWCAFIVCAFLKLLLPRILHWQASQCVQRTAAQPCDLVASVSLLAGFARNICREPHLQQALVMWAIKSHASLLSIHTPENFVSTVLSHVCWPKCDAHFSHFFNIHLYFVRQMVRNQDQQQPLILVADLVHTCKHENMKFKDLINSVRNIAYKRCGYKRHSATEGNVFDSLEKFFTIQERHDGRGALYRRPCRKLF